MYCSISGEVPQEPVISAKSGHLFEKRLIEKALEANNNVCPATGAELSKDDLIPVQADLAIRPRPLTATSLPGMLAMFQNEWDDVMLETHQLKQQLYATRKELSHALYQHDAACRVIARLVRERDEARAQIGELQHVAASGEQDDVMQVEDDVATPLDSDVAAKLTDFWQSASKGRKKRPVPPGLATHDHIRRWTASGPSTPLEDCSVVAVSRGRVFAASSTALSVLDDTLQVQHSVPYAAISIAPCPGGAVAACDETTAAIFGPNLDKILEFDTRGRLNGVAVHPTGDYVAIGRHTSSWDLCDVPAGKRLARAVSPSPDHVATAPLAFHPDGLILAQASATSTEHVIRVWDVKDAQNVATFDGHANDVLSLCFSENGYYMASAAGDGVRVWDLRKLTQVHHIPGDAMSVAFDHSGKYLASAGANSLRVDVVKEWTSLVNLGVPATALAFGPLASYLAVATRAGTLTFVKE